MLLGEPGAAVREPAAARGLEKLPGGHPLGTLRFRVLEGRAERLDPRRLRVAAHLAHPRQRALDFCGLARLEPEAGPRDDLVGPEVRTAVGESELVRRAAV